METADQRIAWKSKNCMDLQIKKIAWKLFALVVDCDDAHHEPLFFFLKAQSDAMTS
jgi:hypothetical protein